MQAAARASAIPAGHARMGASVLVIRRRQGEGIAIGNEIQIDIIDVSRTRVKLGIKVPRQLEVKRRDTDVCAVENRKASALLSESNVLDLAGMAVRLRKASQIPPKTGAL